MEQSDEEKLAEIHRLTRYKNEELAKEIDDKLLCVVESRRTVPKYIAEMESRIAKLKLDRLLNGKLAMPTRKVMTHEVADTD